MASKKKGGAKPRNVVSVGPQGAGLEGAESKPVHPAPSNKKPAGGACLVILRNAPPVWFAGTDPVAVLNAAWEKHGRREVVSVLEDHDLEGKVIP